MRAFAQGHPEYGVRIYRTLGGLRVVVTRAGAAPGTPITDRLLDELGADPLYRTLSTTYQSYRARLSPKPWRVGWRSLEADPEASDESLYGVLPRDDSPEWLATYQRLSQGFAVCRVIDTIGVPPEPDEARVLALHDNVTGVSHAAPLA